MACYTVHNEEENDGRMSTKVYFILHFQPAPHGMEKGEWKMKERPYTQFYARLLGGFSLYFNQEEIQFSAHIQTKYM